MKMTAATFDITAIPGAQTADLNTEVRRQIRYPLRAPASFTWFSREGRPCEAKGYSRNIGEGGAYILAKNCPPVGSQIILVVRFLHLPSFAAFRQLEMSGRVVRAESLPGGRGMWGFAVASAWIILQEAEDSCEESHGAE